MKNRFPNKYFKKWCTITWQNKYETKTEEKINLMKLDYNINDKNENKIVSFNDQISMLNKSKLRLKIIIKHAFKNMELGIKSILQILNKLTLQPINKNY